MKVKKTTQIICMLTVFLIFAAPALARETAPQEVLQSAKDGLSSFLKAIPFSDLRHYGFSAGEDLSRATLGTAFRVYTITPDKIMDFESNMKLSSLVFPTELWFFPVLYNGEFRTILTVDKMNGQWQAVAIGSSGLATQLEDVAAEWPESEGYEYKFIRIYQARSDFVILSQKEMIRLFPLESARIALKLTETGKKGSKLYKTADIIPKLIPIVSQNIQSDGAIEH